jgi:mercuric transport protein
MRKLLAATILAAGLSTAAVAAEKTETLKVSGWHCANCASRTESALKGMNGVNSVAADKAKNQIVVTYDDAKVKHAELEKAVADAGYSIEK